MGQKHDVKNWNGTLCITCLSEWPCVGYRLLNERAMDKERENNLYAHYRGKTLCPDPEDACWGCTLKIRERRIRKLEQLVNRFVHLDKRLRLRSPATQAEIRVWTSLRKDARSLLTQPEEAQP